jgi:hypothetical protein
MAGLEPQVARPALVAVKQAVSLPSCGSGGARLLIPAAPDALVNVSHVTPIAAGPFGPFIIALFRSESVREA